jgi:hypothetical protein
MKQSRIEQIKVALPENLYKSTYIYICFIVIQSFKKHLSYVTFDQNSEVSFGDSIFTGTDDLKQSVGVILLVRLG